MTSEKYKVKISARKNRINSSRKGIMIIGGGILQISALQKAKELNLATYLTDGSENCPARDYADFFYPISTKDLDGTVRLARILRREGKIGAVYTQGTDVEYTVAYAASKAGLPGINPRTARNCNDKIRMREKLQRHGLHHTPFASAHTKETLKEAFQKVGFPCYIKPADNSASRGITRLTGMKHAQEAFTQALGACHHRKKVLIEKEIPGREYSIDTVLYKGKLYPAGVSDRIFLQKKAYAVQVGSRTPSLLPAQTQARMYSVMEQAAGALGVTDGAFKGDLVVSNKGDVSIIEVTARTSGGFDSQMRKPLSFGIDIIKATIDIAFGKPLDARDLIPKWVKYSSTISTFPESGIVISINGTEEVERMKGVHKIIILIKVGETIEPYTDCAKRTNYTICWADTLQELISLEKKVLKTLIIKTKPL